MWEEGEGFRRFIITVKHLISVLFCWFSWPHRPLRTLRRPLHVVKALNEHTKYQLGSRLFLRLTRMLSRDFNLIYIPQDLLIAHTLMTNVSTSPPNLQMSLPPPPKIYKCLYLPRQQSVPDEPTWKVTSRPASARAAGKDAHLHYLCVTNLRLENVNYSFIWIIVGTSRWWE